MRISGLKDEAVDLINRAIAPLGGYVDTDRVTLLSDGKESKDSEEITLTLVFKKEYRLAKYILQYFSQADPKNLSMDGVSDSFKI